MSRRALLLTLAAPGSARRQLGAPARPGGAGSPRSTPLED